MVFFRFFSEGFDSKGTASLESCVADYYFHSLAATAVFADATANKCWFGVSSTTTGNIVVSASSWTVFVKLGKPYIFHHFSIVVLRINHVLLQHLLKLLMGFSQP